MGAKVEDTSPLLAEDRQISPLGLQSRGDVGSSPTQKSAAGEHSLSVKLLAAAFYGGASLSIMFVLKYVLTTFGFPSASLVALFQMAITITLLPGLKAFKYISYPDISSAAIMAPFPLPLLFLGNTVSSLLATKGISIPMYTCLRRFTVLFLMLGETWSLGVVHSSRIKLSVFFMVFGAIVAASNDLSFHLASYIAIFAADVFTAANGVVVKRKLSTLPPAGGKKQIELGKWGLAFYNSLWSLPLLGTYMVLFKQNELERAAAFSEWRNPVFVVLFLLSGLMGIVIQLSIFYCTQINGPLFTGVIGSLKNIISTFLGMVLPGMDYVFSLVNFIGVCTSLGGAVYYSYLRTFGKKN